MIKQIKVPYWQPSDVSGNGLSSKMDQLPKQVMEFAPWPAFPYKPKVQFTIAHSGDHIFVKYYVWEKEIRAEVTQINGPVWEDTCAEFFISFDGEYYYNIECNCIGTLLIGYGKGKEDRVHLAPELIGLIRHVAYLEQREKNVYWELTLAIPLAVFNYHQFPSLQNLKCRCNFYKCGDALQDPYFLSWTNIEHPEPNYHLPDFFGEMIFE